MTKLLQYKIIQHCNIFLDDKDLKIIKEKYNGNLKQYLLQEYNYQKLKSNSEHEELTDIYFEDNNI